MSPYAFVVAAITLGGFWVASSYILISQTKAVEGESDKRLAEMVWQLKARSAEEQRRWEKRMQSATARCVGAVLVFFVRLLCDASKFRLSA